MKQIIDILNLREGENDRALTLEQVKKDIEFKGANLWILACAIMVASVGLNVNSTAVIIGAMLISPLMGPIVGAGFALGIYDFALLKKSLRNLLNATFVSLAVSTLYFYLSPFKDVQSELLARTSPNIYDILIAFFGGIVGVIAITRTEKGNPVPGVAIATALMPPLCTAGYGLATGQWTFFLGAFYLYIINCVFIGIATFLIIKYLNYPPVKQIDEKQQKRVKLIIVVVTTSMLIPSSYLAFSLYVEQQFKKNVDLFLDDEFSSKGYTVVYKKTEFNPQKKKIELAFLSKKFDAQEIKELKTKLNRNKYLKETELLIRQDSDDKQDPLKNDLLNKIKSSENEMDAKDLKVLHLEKELAKNKFDNEQLLKETKTLFPAISSLSVTKTNFVTESDSTYAITAVIYDGKGTFNETDQKKFKDWLSARLAVKDVEIFKKQ